ncbi:MAG TPA: hypothetical protein DFS52_14390, partial [Myxococcales bacterium]|nr:hypothetical protein [Myxococcales bacterium]
RLAHLAARPAAAAAAATRPELAALTPVAARTLLTARPSGLGFNLRGGRLGDWRLGASLLGDCLF